eukprot:Gb_08807 [translate_table: standard]
MGNSQSGLLTYPYLALKSSMEQAERGSNSCWYARASSLLRLIGLGINRSPPHNFSVDALDLSKGEINKGIRTEIYRAYLRYSWHDPRESLSSKLHHYLDLYLQLSDGFIQRPRCSPYYEIRGWFFCLFIDSFGSLQTLMVYENQRCLALFFQEMFDLRRWLTKGKFPKVICTGLITSNPLILVGRGLVANFQVHMIDLLAPFIILGSGSLSVRLFLASESDRTEKGEVRMECHGGTGMRGQGPGSFAICMDLPVILIVCSFGKWWLVLLSVSLLYALMTQAITVPFNLFNMSRVEVNCASRLTCDHPHEGAQIKSLSAVGMPHTYHKLHRSLGILYPHITALVLHPFRLEAALNRLHFHDVDIISNSMKLPLVNDGLVVETSRLSDMRSAALPARGHLSSSYHSESKDGHLTHMGYPRVSSSVSGRRSLQTKRKSERNSNTSDHGRRNLNSQNVLSLSKCDDRVVSRGRLLQSYCHSGKNGNLSVLVRNSSAKFTSSKYQSVVPCEQQLGDFGCDDYVGDVVVRNILQENVSGIEGRRLFVKNRGSDEDKDDYGDSMEENCKIFNRKPRKTDRQPSCRNLAMEKVAILKRGETIKKFVQDRSSDDAENRQDPARARLFADNNHVKARVAGDDNDVSRRDGAAVHGNKAKYIVETFKTGSAAAIYRKKTKAEPDASKVGSKITSLKTSNNTYTDARPGVGGGGSSHNHGNPCKSGNDLVITSTKRPGPDPSIISKGASGLLRSVSAESKFSEAIGDEELSVMSKEFGVRSHSEGEVNVKIGSPPVSSDRAESSFPFFVAEKWAGPTYSNSPSPSCLPLPKFKVRPNAADSFDLERLQTKANKTNCSPGSPFGDKETQSAFPRGQSSANPTNQVGVDAFATRNLLRLLRLE